MDNFYFAWPVYFYKKRFFDYDHPALIKDYLKKETSTRLIDSIQKNLPKYSCASIFIIPARSKEKISTERLVDLLVKSIQKKSKIDSRIKIFILTNRVLTSLKKILPFTDYLDNCGYGNVRNLILITQILFNVPYLINLDDDEIIPNENFFFTVQQIIKKIKREEKLVGVGGLCVNKNFNPRVSYQKKLNAYKNIFEQRKFLQQQLVDYYLKKKWIIPVGAVFGGINIMSQEVALKCCYDPFIPRGEDIDFVINAYVSGFLFGGLSNFNIIHKPPSLKPVQEKYKLLKDIKRFIYEKKKVDYLALHHKLKKEKILSVLDPYPGYFLREDEEKLFKDANFYLDKKILDNLIKKEIPQALNQYLEFSNKWQNFIERLKNFRKIIDFFVKI